MAAVNAPQYAAALACVAFTAAFGVAGAGIHRARELSLANAVGLGALCLSATCYLLCLLSYSAAATGSGNAFLVFVSLASSFAASSFLLGALTPNHEGRRGDGKAQQVPFQLMIMSIGLFGWGFLYCAAVASKSLTASWVTFMASASMMAVARILQLSQVGGKKEGLQRARRWLFWLSLLVDTLTAAGFVLWAAATASPSKASFAAFLAFLDLLGRSTITTALLGLTRVTSATNGADQTFLQKMAQRALDRLFPLSVSLPEKRPRQQVLRVRFAPGKAQVIGQGAAYSPRHVRDASTTPLEANQDDNTEGTTEDENSRQNARVESEETTPAEVREEVQDLGPETSTPEVFGSAISTTMLMRRLWEERKHRRAEPKEVSVPIDSVPPAVTNGNAQDKPASGLPSSLAKNPSFRVSTRPPDFVPSSAVSSPSSASNHAALSPLSNGRVATAAALATHDHLPIIIAPSPTLSPSGGRRGSVSYSEAGAFSSRTLSAETKEAATTQQQQERALDRTPSTPAVDDSMAASANIIANACTVTASFIFSLSPRSEEEKVAESATEGSPVATPASALFPPVAPARVAFVEVKPVAPVCDAPLSSSEGLLPAATIPAVALVLSPSADQPVQLRLPSRRPPRVPVKVTVPAEDGEEATLPIYGASLTLPVPAAEPSLAAPHTAASRSNFAAFAEEAAAGSADAAAGVTSPSLLSRIIASALTF